MADPSAYRGQEMRTMFDRQTSGWIEANAFIFDAVFDDGLKAEVQVNPDFGSPEAAEREVAKYLQVIGKLPTYLRKMMKSVWIRRSAQRSGGGNGIFLIHTNQALEYERSDVLKEILFPDATHTSIDSIYSTMRRWLKAQKKDGAYISYCAQDKPNVRIWSRVWLPIIRSPTALTGCRKAILKRSGTGSLIP